MKSNFPLLRASMLVPAIVLGAVLAVPLPARAQDPGEAKELFRNGILIGGTQLDFEDRGPQGVSLPASKNTPQGVTFSGTLTGIFADSSTGKIVADGSTGKVIQETVELNNAPTRSLIKGQKYHFAVTAVTSQAILYGLTLGVEQKRVVDRDNVSISPVKVILEKPTKAIFIEGDINAGLLLQNDAAWQVVVDPVVLPNPTETKTKAEYVDSRTRAKGAITGEFLGLDHPGGKERNRHVFRTQGLADPSAPQYAWLAADYKMAATFTAVNTEKGIYGAAFGIPGDPTLLRVLVDAPQSALFLQGVVNGKRFSGADLGVGAVDHPIIDIGDTSPDGAKPLTP